MRTIKTTTGADIPLDGDLLAIMETLYREVTAKRELERSFEDMVHEITHLIGQMDDDERRAYLLESLFLNTVKYENDKLAPTLRTAVMMRDIQEMTYQEIADSLDLPEGTVKSRINRGRTELARQIQILRAQQDAARGVTG